METPKKKIYVAGPMRGLPEFNYPAFNRAEFVLRNLDYEVVNPAKMGDKYGTADELNANKDLLDRLMHEELEAIAGCHAIYLLRGWERSFGARQELQLALMLGLEIVQQEDNEMTINVHARTFEEFYEGR